MTGADVLKQHAPAVWAALGQLDATRPTGLDDLLADPAVAELHERFVADATTIDDDLRERFRAAAGDRAAAVMDVVYADDLLPRVITMLDNLFGLSVWPTYQDVEVDDLGPAVDALVGAIDALDLLDAELDDAVRRRVDDLAAAPMLAPPAGTAARTTAALALADAYIRAPFDLVEALEELVEQLLDPATTVGVILTAARRSRVRAEVALSPSP